MRLQPFFALLLALTPALADGVAVPGVPRAIGQTGKQGAAVKYAPGGGGGGGCSQATTYLARTTGGNEGGNSANITTLICGLVADGVIDGTLAGATGGCGTKLDVLYILAQQNALDAIRNLCGTTYTLIPNGATFTTYLGYSAYLTPGMNTNFAPSTATSPNFTLNSGSVGAWTTSAVLDTTPIITTGNAGVNSNLLPRFTGNLFYARVNNGTSASVPSPGSAGLFVGDRSSSANVNPYWNGVSQGTIAATPIGVAATPFNIGYFGGVASVQPTSAVFIGGSLGATLQLALYNRLRTYMTAVGVP